LCEARARHIDHIGNRGSDEQDSGVDVMRPNCSLGKQGIEHTEPGPVRCFGRDPQAGDERKRKQRAHREQRVVQSHRSRERGHHRHQPGDEAVPEFAAVERALEPRRPRKQRAGDRLAVAERTPLLDGKRGDNCQDTHASIL